MRSLNLFNLSFLFYSISLFQPTFANSISGKELKEMITHELTLKNVQSAPAIDDKRIFNGCDKENIVINRRDVSWNTLKLSCKYNKYWNFNFRNKIFAKGNNEKGVISLNREHFFDKKIDKNSFNEKNLVFVLANSKLKDEILKKEDIKLDLRKRILSKGSFSKEELLLGKKLKKSLKKGTIIKDKYLKKDWLVHKNQKIEIENQVGSIKVTMQGIALSNGLKGDRILVKNLSSNKTVEGFVKSEKKISIFRKIY